MVAFLFNNIFFLIVIAGNSFILLFSLLLLVFSIHLLLLWRFLILVSWHKFLFQLVLFLIVLLILFIVLVIIFISIMSMSAWTTTPLHWSRSPCLNLEYIISINLTLSSSEAFKIFPNLIIDLLFFLEINLIILVFPLVLLPRLFDIPPLVWILLLLFYFLFFFFLFYPRACVVNSK